MVTVISGTNRRDSKTLGISKYCLEALLNGGEEAKLLDLAMHQYHLFSPEVYDEFKEVNNFTVEYFSASSVFLIIVPEYNGSFSGFLKYLIDVIPPKYFRGKIIGLIGVASGRAGNLRGIDHLTGVFHHMKCDVYFHKPPLSRIEELVSLDGSPNAELGTLLTSFIHNFIGYVKAKE